MAKTALGSEGPAARTTRAVLARTLDTVLRLLHPIIPFVTDELWSLVPHDGELLDRAPYPRNDPALRDETAREQVGFLIEAVTAIRNARAEAGIPPPARIGCRLAVPAARTSLVEPVKPYLAALARLSEVEIGPSPPAGRTPSAIVGGVEIYVSAPAREAGADRARLESELQSLLREVEPWAKKLDNPQFVERAKPEAVDKARRVHRELAEKIDRIRESLGAS
jgi:valyl-tRNA synthetase